MFSGVRDCRAVDLVFVIFDSLPAASYPNIYPSSLQIVKAFAQSVVMGPADYNIGITYSAKALTSPIPLQSSYSSLNSLLIPNYDTSPSTLSMFSGLARASIVLGSTQRTAFKAVVVFYNGQPIPTSLNSSLRLLTNSEIFLMVTPNYASDPASVALATQLSPKSSNLLVFDTNSDATRTAGSLLTNISASCASSPLKMSNSTTRVVAGGGE